MNAVLKSRIPAFAESLRVHGVHLDRLPLEILQINVGKRCNQACHHCHVDAGPKRTEMMDARTAARLIELMQDSPRVHTVDITGGAPELNPQFRALVRAAHALGKKVIDRCNLTVLFEPGQEDTAEFLAMHGVAIVASLPCYSKANVEKQRGLNVFEPSIAAERIPPREQFQPTIAERARVTDDAFQLFEGEIFVADPRCYHCQICHPTDSLEWIFFHWNKLDCTPAFAQRFFPSPEIGIDQPKQAQFLAVIGLSLHHFLLLRACSDKS